MVGGMLCGIGWVMNAYADTLMLLYIAAAIGGIGAGAVYGTCVGNALKWFPDRRGLAAGLHGGGFRRRARRSPSFRSRRSSSRAVTKPRSCISASAQGMIVCLIAWALTDPRHVVSPALAKKAAARSQSREILQTTAQLPSDWRSSASRCSG